MNVVASSIVRRYTQLAKTIQKGGKIDASFLSSHYAYPVREDVVGVSTPEAAEPTLADDKSLSIPFVISTFEEDRDGDVVYPMGARLDNYERNPVVFFGHQSYEVPIGKSKSPDGRLCVYPEENRLRATCFFDPDDPDAVFIYQKCKNGYLSAASVAFVPIIAHRRVRQKANLHENRHENPPGWYFEEYDLTEWSIVGVPANAGAIRDTLDRESGFISPFLYKAMKPFAKQAKTCFNGWCPCPPCPGSKCEKLFVTDPAEGVNIMAAKTTTKSAGSVHKHNCKDCSKSKPCGECQKKAMQKGVRKNTQADMETSTVNVPKKTSKKEDCVSRKIDFLVHEGHKPPSQDPQTTAIAMSYCSGGKGFRTAAVEKLSDGEIAYLLRGIGSDESVRMVVKGKTVTSLATANCPSLTVAKKALGFSITKDLNEASGTAGGYTVPPGKAGKKTKKKAAKDFDDEEMDEAEDDDKKGEAEGKKNDKKKTDEDKEESDKGDEANEVTKDKSDETGGVVKSESEETGGVVKGEDGDDEEMDEEVEEKGEKGDKKEPYNDGMDKDTTEMPDEPLPSAQILANLYSHMKSAMKYINDENPRHEHEDIKSFLENHKNDLAGHMEEYKGLMRRHHKPHDIDEMVKAIEGPAASGETDPDANLEGEEGMVAEGAVPPEEQGEEAVGEDQVHPDLHPTEKEEPVEDVTETEEVTENPDGSKEGEMTNEEVVDKDAEQAPGEGMEEDEDNDMTTKSTQEILERYRHPKSGKWETRKRYIQAGKLLPVGQKPVVKGVKTDADKSDFEAIRDAGQHMYDLAKAVDLPRHHTTGLMHHANELGKMCSKMEGGMEAEAPEQPGAMEEKDCNQTHEHLTSKDPDTKDPQLEEKGTSANLMDGNNHPKPKKDPKLIDKSGNDPVSKEILEEFAALKRIAKNNGILTS